MCLEESLHIHNIRDMKILHTIRDTPPNPRGLCALSPCVDHCYVAYPGSSAVGEVQIFDAVHLVSAAPRESPPRPPPRPAHPRLRCRTPSAC